jgi:hypothetical protein
VKAMVFVQSKIVILISAIPLVLDHMMHFPMIANNTNIFGRVAQHASGVDFGEL